MWTLNPKPLYMWTLWVIYTFIKVGLCYINFLRPRIICLAGMHGLVVPFKGPDPEGFSALIGLVH